VIQHLPIFREAWTLSLRGRASTASSKDGQEIPFFMLPALGGGSDLRGFDSWRFRDRDSLLLQAEWRIMVNRYLDTAVFYDAGTVAKRFSDLDLHGMKSDFGFGAASTPRLRRHCGSTSPGATNEPASSSVHPPLFEVRP
jgi:outer membrane protein assembly factor BamA